MSPVLALSLAVNVVVLMLLILAWIEARRTRETLRQVRNDLVEIQKVMHAAAREGIKSPTARSAMRGLETYFSAQGRPLP